MFFRYSEYRWSKTNEGAIKHYKVKPTLVAVYQGKIYSKINELSEKESVKSSWEGCHNLHCWKMSFKMLQISNIIFTWNVKSGFEQRVGLIQSFLDTNQIKQLFVLWHDSISALGTPGSIHLIKSVSTGSIGFWSFSRKPNDGTCSYTVCSFMFKYAMIANLFLE